MKSIKPGRGPSMMSGVLGIFMIGFGIFWTVLAAQASVIFAVFGILWICIAVTVTVYNFKNATGKNRYSAYDITDGLEEPDPLNERFGNTQSTAQKQNDAGNKFCPYCGTAVENDYEFCNNCGKKLPQHGIGG